MESDEKQMQEPEQGNEDVTNAPSEEETLMDSMKDTEAQEGGRPEGPSNDVHDAYISQVKQWRKDLDRTLQEIKERAPGARETSLTVTKLQEGIMWLGMELKRLNTPNPYPNSYNPENTIIEPTADDLKL